MRTAYLFFAVLLLATSVFAQGDYEDCPTIAVSGPLMGVSVGDNASFSVTLSEEADKKKLEYVWSVDSGSLISGQGTTRVSISVEGDGTATVEVKGLDAICTSTASYPLKTGAKSASPIFFDEFSKVKDKLLAKRIAALANALLNTPEATGYVITYGSASKTASREQDIQQLINGISGLDSSRVIFSQGGEEKDVRTRVWIVPSGFDVSGLN